MLQNLLKSATDCCRTERQIKGEACNTCRSTMPARELSANDSEETVAI